MSKLEVKVQKLAIDLQEMEEDILYANEAAEDAIFYSPTKRDSFPTDWKQNSIPNSPSKIQTRNTRVQ